MTKHRLCFSVVSLVVVSLISSCLPMQDLPRPGDDEAADAEGFFTSHQYAEAIPLLEAAVKKQAMFGSASRDLNYSKLQLGQCYARTGNYEKAQENLLQCLPYVTLMQGECLEELGDVAVKQNQLSSAEAYYSDAIKWHEKKNEQFNVVVEKQKLARVAEKLKKYELAESLLVWLNDNECKRYTGIAKAYGPFDLAEYYDRIGEKDKAQSFYLETINIMEKEHKGGPQYTGYYYMKLGDFYAKNKDTTKAKASYQKALDLYKGRKLLSAPPPDNGIREGHPSVEIYETDRKETQKKFDAI
ncbi:tetratricopeptide repeat protein [Candidatus Obscuribacterales bacterium]|nr:tetratricopeptide repeat protein [Candidatus Obscuribacterales bacterium]MBX3153590.1 tetratricopeptide repeat protein [Candidatus Obscuribacterales bacterium]